jgi:hypothetical protein
MVVIVVMVVTAIFETKFFPHHQSDSLDRESVLAVKKCLVLKIVF